MRFAVDVVCEWDHVGAKSQIGATLAACRTSVGACGHAVLAVLRRFDWSGLLLKHIAQVGHCGVAKSLPLSTTPPIPLTLTLLLLML